MKLFDAGVPLFPFGIGFEILREGSFNGCKDFPRFQKRSNRSQHAAIFYEIQSYFPYPMFRETFGRESLTEVRMGRIVAVNDFETT